MSEFSKKVQSIVVVRTNNLHASVVNLVKTLSTSSRYKVVICADETSGCIGNVGEATKISVSKTRYQEMGLFTEYDTMWRCGDYCLYAAIQEFPEVERIWMIEPDVYINSDITSFFETTEASISGVDFVAVRFSKSNETSPWQETMAPFYPERYTCHFPLISITARAVKTLFDERLRMSELFRNELAVSGTIAVPYPNDEAFTATVCMNNGYRCEDLNAFGVRRYSDETFSYVIPASEKYLKLSPQNAMVYHPVVSGEAFKAKADFLLEYCRDKVRGSDRAGVMRPVLATIGHKLAIEVGYAYALTYLANAEVLLTTT